MKKPLSKSRIMAGLQCHKRLYLEMFNKGLARAHTPAEKLLFKTGHEVGAEAQKHFPGGLLIDAPHWDFSKNLQMTDKAIADGVNTIYEASFQFEDFYCRIDILNKVDNEWEIIEVKASTQAKKQHLTDAAIQAWIVEKLGLKVRSVQIMHINNQCVAPNLKNLFFKKDITEDAKKLYPLIDNHLAKIKTVVEGSRAPDMDIGPHCDDPYECLFKEHCFQSQLVPRPSVFDLPGMGKKAWDYYKSEQVALHDVEAKNLNDLQKRMIEVSQSGQAHIDAEGIRNELKLWQFPLNYLDFEAVGFSIPKIHGTRPYEAIPFQYSLHIEENIGDEPHHREYLHNDDGDPRRPFVEKLLSDLGPQGSVVAYNKSYESQRLKDLAEACPDYQRQLLDIESRLVDPLPILQKYVYHPEFFGSFSIKSVGPALLGSAINYKTLTVQDGNMAQESYVRMLAMPEGSEDRENLRAALIEYCCLDSWSMVLLVKWLRDHAAN